MEPDTGLFQLRDVPLSCEALNEFLVGSPVMITNATVDELAVTVSWAAVNDGCQIALSGVHITISPCNHSRDSNNGMNSTTIESSSQPSQNQQSINEEEGVLFLANWIDIIVSRFHVQLIDLQIDITTSMYNSPTLRLSISELNYYNSKPEDHAVPVNNSSRNMSRTSMSSAELAAETLRNTDRSALMSVIISEQGSSCIKVYLNCIYLCYRYC